MKKIAILLLSVLIQTAYAQEFIQLIGLETDNSGFSEGSYSVMYDNTNDDKQKVKSYVPLKTLGIYRKDNKVQIFSLDYLLVPTKKGFLYATMGVEETKINPADYEEYLSEDALKEYQLGSSITKPKFFKNKKQLLTFMQKQMPTFQDAISIDFEKISYLNANFYLTTGFESEVNGSASWFNAMEKTAIYPLDWQGKLSNELLDYVDNNTKNNVVIRAISQGAYESIETDITKDYVLPWAGSIDNHKEVYFDLQIGNNGVYVVPMVLLNGNSSRRFLAPTQPLSLYSKKDFYKTKIHKALKLTPPQWNQTDDLWLFNSPDQSTYIIIDKNKRLVVKDIKSNQILASQKINFNNIIMSEFAVGNYAQKWKEQFE
ncbi:hypothetical protein QJU43_07060 [Pasteurella atlantica]|uniref:hypothetical protein n=1 Tax=Pasteurellaceae TaxID=712 RepID=UPI00275AD9F0|nr:hypothetical protein [Pasteurella atlantica]MDP8033859.1 hypothetical protein [Pasteurella atlantica]MDP8035862.1 hypothetical protein [Pasteurella atlantica]MDP8037799.1 hypothetical protein [Pasteurella atlantica]MDP8048095.1 hypothetical protein [Pasteurella atlantica]MDP8050185.1 hypothetical protein [Pasteurella atlantica]